MSLELLINILVSLFALGGIAFILLGAIGIHRMPDIYTRIHAASLIDTGGVTLITISLCIYAAYINEWMAIIKLILAYIFIIFTSPTASHAVAKMAILSQQTPVDKEGNIAVDDDLIDKRRKKAQAKKK